MQGERKIRTTVTIKESIWNKFLMELTKKHLILEKGTISKEIEALLEKFRFEE